MEQALGKAIRESVAILPDNVVGISWEILFDPVEHVEDLPVFVGGHSQEYRLSEVWVIDFGSNFHDAR